MRVERKQAVKFCFKILLILEGGKIQVDCINKVLKFFDVLEERQLWLKGRETGFEGQNDEG